MAEKHRLENIANRAIPVDGTEFMPEPGQIVEAEITPKLKKMIKDGFFRNLGLVPYVDYNHPEVKVEKKAPVPVGPIEAPTKKTKKGRKKKKPIKEEI